MKDRIPDAALLRGMTQRRFSRRDILRISGLSAATMFAAACGVRGQSPNPGSSGPLTAEQFWAGKESKGHIEFANWPLYMDEGQPELVTFTEETGITVAYSEVINDTAEWFATTQPQLAAGRSIGYDLMVITNGAQFQKFVAGGYLAPLDHTRLRNFAANVAPSYKNSSFDPGNIYSIPWASGFTGLAYDPTKTGRPITSLEDLKDPAFAGRVGLMSDVQELGNFGLWAVGKNPATSTPDDWEEAAAWLQDLKAKGAIRDFYDQDFIEALQGGDIWIAQAWSGDIFQQRLEGSPLEFVIPDEGGTIWTDNMTIPVTAENPYDAITLMDYFYNTEVAATLAEYIGYITPVPGAKAAIEAHAADAESDEDREYYEEAASSPLIFPSAADYAKVSYYRDFANPVEEQDYNDIFEPVVLG
jgi:spermidine/putrescine transport system substrate-binding protein